MTPHELSANDLGHIMADQRIRELNQQVASLESALLAARHEQDTLSAQVLALRQQIEGHTHTLLDTCTMTPIPEPTIPDLLTDLAVLYGEASRAAELWDTDQERGLALTLCAVIRRCRMIEEQAASYQQQIVGHAAWIAAQSDQLTQNAERASGELARLRGLLHRVALAYGNREDEEGESLLEIGSEIHKEFLT